MNLLIETIGHTSFFIKHILEICIKGKGTKETGFVEGVNKWGEEGLEGFQA